MHALGVEGVTQRMLTRTLRQLERDGLISRRDHREVPPRGDYALTELGRGLLQGMSPLWGWVIDNADWFRAARDRFDTDNAGADDGPGQASSAAGRTRSTTAPVPRS
ncbi:protein of unknown function [Rhodovastum atsumiense]|uniref:winged helix-turn-helix transcriptional regulator n=1 Tax=Rhodovastum atsumiense TaxID=504468 RepID=UPI001EEFCCF6|nr:helix-turn-helix domain-containing protein [Rhodovastum atsumiense]CAH2602575.1 protein of unknown function [Rhodovastum atsumiense]